MFFFDFNWQIQSFLNQFFWPVNFLLLAILVILGYLAYKKPAYAAGLTIILLPTYLFRSKIWFLPVTFLELCIWITFIGWVFSLLRTKSYGPKAAGYKWPIILILLAGTVSVFVSPDKTAAAGLWKAYFIEPIIFFIVVINVTRVAEPEGSTAAEAKASATRNKNHEIILWSLGISTLVISGLAIFQKFTGFGIAEVGWVAVSRRRVTSVFTSPNAVGLYLGPIVAIYLGWLTAEIKNYKKVILKLLIIIPALSAIAFTISQGTWIGLLAAVVFLGYFGWNKKWTTVIIALLITATLFIPSVRNKALPILTFQDPAGQNRVELMKISYDYLVQSPKNFILGAGIFGFPQIHEQLRDPLKTEPLLYPHNILLNFWLEIGLLGLIAFVWLIIKFLRNGFKNMRPKTSPGADWLNLGAMSAMTAIIIHGLVDVPYFKNDLAMLFWIVIGLIIINSRLHKKMHFHKKHTTPIILGDKTATWRLWDDKNLAAGDMVDFLETETEKKFATAVIINTVEKPIGKLTTEDRIGHEEFQNQKEMYEAFEKYYKKPVGPETIVKIVRFKLISNKK